MKAEVDTNGLASCLQSYTALLPGLMAMREGINLYGATLFSPFAVFKPDENTLSRVISELFDPLGSHGQGLLFLNGLLSALGIPTLNRLESVKVRREVLTRGKRRIDIVIETARYVIGIENKPWASQQQNQLIDYLDELKADLHARTPVLVFLSDQVAQTAEAETHRLPYFTRRPEAPSLHHILVRLVSEIRAQQPKAFVEDFIRFIESEFGGVRLEDHAVKPFHDAVCAEFDNPQHKKAVAAILLSQEVLHFRILDEIGQHIINEVRQKANVDFYPSCPWEDVQPNVSECLWHKWTPFGLRRPAWPANCHVAVEASSDWYDGIILGVRCPDINKLPEKDKGLASPGHAALENLTQQIPGGKKTNYWPWYRPLSSSYWGQEFCARIVLESPSGAVKDHPEIQDISRQLVELAIETDKTLSKHFR